MNSLSRTSIDSPATGNLCNLFAQLILDATKMYSPCTHGHEQCEHHCNDGSAAALVDSETNNSNKIERKSIIEIQKKRNYVTRHDLKSIRFLYLCLVPWAWLMAHGIIPVRRTLCTRHTRRICNKTNPFGCRRNEWNHKIE